MRHLNIVSLFIGCCTILITTTQTSYAFQMNPLERPDTTIVTGTGEAVRIEINKYFSQVSQPLHEIMTVSAFRCKQRPIQCGSQHILMILPALDTTLGQLVDGAEWNDDPAKFLMKAQTAPRWLELYKDGRKEVKKCSSTKNGCESEQYFLIYRSHFMDMQFLHSMASKNGEPASETQKKIMIWAEYTYKLSTGEIKPTTEIDKSGTLVNSLVLRQGWDAYDLFFDEPGRVYTYKTLIKDRNYTDDKRKQIQLKERDKRRTDLIQEVSPEGGIGRVKRIALGSLLHMIQDSFSDSHTQRSGSCDELNDDKGKIVEFHNYFGQEVSDHAIFDKVPTWMTQDNVQLSSNNPVVHSAWILNAVFRQTPLPWGGIGGVEEYLLNNVFKLSTDAVPSRDDNLRKCLETH